MTTFAMAPALDSCVALPLRGGTWGAYRVTGVERETVEVLAVDFISKRAPKLNTLRKAAALRLDHHSHTGEPLRATIRLPLPEEHRFVGVLDCGDRPAEPCRSRSNWVAFERSLRRQLWWNRCVPSVEKRRYKASSQSAKVAVAVGEGAELSRCLSEIVVGPGDDHHLQVLPDEAVAWSELDVLGQLWQIDYHGRDAAVVDYVRSRKLIDELGWFDHGRQEVDLRGVGVHTLDTRSASKLVLYLDCDVETLTLRGHRKGCSVRVLHPCEGDEMNLRLWRCSDAPPQVRGLSRLSELEVHAQEHVDLRRVAKYRHLRALKVNGRMVHLSHPEALGNLTELRRLTLNNCYGPSTADLPDLEQLPQLSQVEIHGIRKSVAQDLRRRWKELDRLDIYGAKDDGWIAANVDNPLRDWVDDDKRWGEKACKAYAKAFRDVTKAQDARAAQKVLVGFVRVLNQVDADGFIDTLRREQAVDAYRALVAQTRISPERALRWLEAERRF